MNMFPRWKKGPLASVMISSRGRPESLKRAVMSCYDLAKDPSSIEVIVKIDDDDAPTRKMIEHLLVDRRLPIKAIETPRGRGFLEMSDWVNLMSSCASGDWLILLNDDAYIMTQDWDSVLLYSGVKSPRFGYESVFLFSLEHRDEPGAYAWPCLRRQTYEILGHFSPILACDLWVSMVMKTIGAMAEVPIQVGHDRLEHEEGETRRGIVDAGEYMRWQMHCVEGRRALGADIYTLAEWLVDRHKRLKWEAKPRGDGWFWWKIAEVATECLTFVAGDRALLFPFASDGEKSVKTLKELNGWWADPLSVYEEN